MTRSTATVGYSSAFSRIVDLELLADAGGHGDRLELAEPGVVQAVAQGLLGDGLGRLDVDLPFTVRVAGPGGHAGRRQQAGVDLLLALGLVARSRQAVASSPVASSPVVSSHRSSRRRSSASSPVVSSPVGRRSPVAPSPGLVVSRHHRVGHRARVVGHPLAVVDQQGVAVQLAGQAAEHLALLRGLELVEGLPADGDLDDPAVLDQRLAVAVEDPTSGRLEDHLAGAVVAGGDLVLVGGEHLEVPEPA